MNAICYFRVSTDEQAASGAGISAQADACEAFARSAGREVTGTFTDDGVSGAAELESRPGLMAAVAVLRKGDALVIAKRDRLGRDPMAILMIERAVTRKGAVILSADGVGNSNDPASVFMKNIVDAAAAYERNLIRARTRAALAAKRRKGERIGGVPFGWNATDDGRLVEDAREQDVLRRIVECREAGMSLREIAAVLREAAVEKKSGGTDWSHTTIQSILKRAALVAA